jgi:hypothetical protein
LGFITQKTLKNCKKKNTGKLLNWETQRPKSHFLETGNVKCDKVIAENGMVYSFFRIVRALYNKFGKFVITYDNIQYKIERV